jgi:hypothetical protein
VGRKSSLTSRFTVPPPDRIRHPAVVETKKRSVPHGSQHVWSPRIEFVRPKK